MIKCLKEKSTLRSLWRDASFWYEWFELESKRTNGEVAKLKLLKAMHQIDVMEMEDIFVSE